MAENAFIDPSAPTNIQMMWKGPNKRDEIEKALLGTPTLIPCAVGPNINDGSGTDFYKRHKGFYTMAEYDQWLSNNQPKAPQLQCPYCTQEPAFTAESKTELQAHIKTCPGAIEKLPKIAAAVEMFNCPVEGCPASFDSEKKLNGHKAGAHKGAGKSKADMRSDDAE